MLKKYKHLTKIQEFKLIPIRVLKFKKSKWNKLKNILIKRIQSTNVEKKKPLIKNIYSRLPLGFRTNKSLLNFSEKLKNKKIFSHFSSFSKTKIQDKFKVYVTRGRFSYLSSLSRDKRQSRLKLKYLLNQTNMVTRQKCKDRDLFIKTIYNDNFCVRGVTSSFYFFHSLRDIKDKIKAKKLLINNKNRIKYDSLSKGDIIKVNSKALKIKKNINAFFLNYSLPSHLEVDIYSQSIVMIKDKSTTIQEDYHLMSLEYINVQKV